MSLILSWPKELPLPSSKSYSLDISHSSARTTMDSGSIRQRRRFRNPKNSLKLTWEFNDVQNQLFQSWVMYGLNGGSNWFYIDIPSGNGIVKHKVRIIEGSLNTQYVGFMNWNISADLDVDKTNMLTEEELFRASENGELSEAGEQVLNGLKKYYTRSWS